MASQNTLAEWVFSAIPMSSPSRKGAAGGMPLCAAVGGRTCPQAALHLSPTGFKCCHQALCLSTCRLPAGAAAGAGHGRRGHAGGRRGLGCRRGGVRGRRAGRWPGAPAAAVGGPAAGAHVPLAVLARLPASRESLIVCVLVYVERCHACIFSQAGSQASAPYSQ